MRRWTILELTVAALAGWAVVSASAAGSPAAVRSEEPSSQRYQFGSFEMGTLFRIILYASDEEQAVRASRAAFHRVQQLDRLLSHYRPDSEVSRLSLEPRVVSSELFLLLERSGEMWRTSRGAFDVTLGPLTELWREARRARRLPLQVEIERRRKQVGFQNVHLDPTRRTVRLLRPGMRLDLGAIGKGFAADEALRVLREHGISQALVDAGGDLRAGRPPPGQVGWRISMPAGEESFVFWMSDEAVATSADDEQFVEIGGVRYSHIVDPRTGYGCTDRRRVTVIAPDALTADAWATVLSVLPPETGLDLVQNLAGVAARIESKETRKVFASPSFNHWIRPAGEALAGVPH